MDAWTLIRFLHLLAMALFVGGQLVLAAAVVPVMRGAGDDTAMRAMGRRFGIASAAALAVLLATGIAMAGHLDRWDDGNLQAKLALLVLVGGLMGLHAVRPGQRAIPIAVLAGSLAIVGLGAATAH